MTGIRQLFARFAVNRRFWKHVDVGGPDECWTWHGPTGRDGTPEFDGRRACVHAYELARGPVEDSARLRHSCGNPSCVNPDHLLIQS